MFTAARACVMSVLLVFLSACGGGSQSTKEPTDANLQTPGLEISGLWDYTTYVNGEPLAEYTFLNISESGVHTGFKFTLNDTGEIDDCSIDEQGQLTFVSNHLYADTITYPTQEAPVNVELYISDGQLYIGYFDRYLPPADTQVATLAELIDSCGDPDLLSDFSSVVGLWDLTNPIEYGGSAIAEQILYIDAEGVTTLFVLNSEIYESEEDGHLQALGNGEFRWIPVNFNGVVENLEDLPILKNVNGNLEVDFNDGNILTFAPFVELTLEELLSSNNAGGNGGGNDNTSECLDTEWHLKSAIPHFSVALIEAPSLGSSSTCLAVSGTNATINTTWIPDARLQAFGWFFAVIPSNELSCAGEQGYVAPENIRLGASGCIPNSNSLRVSDMNYTAPALMDSPSLNSGTKLCTAFGNTKIQLMGDEVLDDQISGMKWRPIRVLNGHCAELLGNTTIYVDPLYLN